MVFLVHMTWIGINRILYNTVLYLYKLVRRIVLLILNISHR